MQMCLFRSLSTLMAQTLENQSHQFLIVRLNSGDMGVVPWRFDVVEAVQFG